MNEQSKSKQPPNLLLINARLALPSPSAPGEPMSRQDLAEAANAWIWDTHHEIDRLDEHDIGNLERYDTRWPRTRRREALRAVLGAGSDADLGFYRNRRPRSPRASPVVGTPDVGAAPLVPADHVPRSTADLELVEFVTVLDRRGVSPGALTAAELTVERLDQQFARLGPDEVLAQVRSLMYAVLGQLRRAQTLRRQGRLVTLAGRLAGLRAWACFDIDEHAEAERWYDAAFTAAQEAQAWSLCAWLLGAQSLVPWHQRDHRRAVDLIERGINFAEQRADSTTKAWLRALEARARAGLQDLPGFQAAYELAEEAASYSNERDRRHGMDFDQGLLDLRYYAGTSRLLLREPERATPALAGSLASLPPSHIKARAVLSLALADAAVQSDNVDQAITLAHDALVTTRHQPIMPILQQARRIRRMIQRRGVAAADELDADLADFARALAGIARRAEQ